MGALRPLVLLVDDDEDVITIFRHSLETTGFDVSVADCVAEALAAARRVPPDVLVTDLGLRDGTGFDILQMVKACGPTRAIALTGSGLDEDRDRCREAGFDLHLTKPVTGDDLARAIDRLVRDE